MRVCRELGKDVEESESELECQVVRAKKRWPPGRVSGHDLRAACFRSNRSTDGRSGPVLQTFISKQTLSMKDIFTRFVSHPHPVSHRNSPSSRQHMSA